MKTPLFDFPSYRYEVSDWEFKKKGILNRINQQEFIRTNLQTFLTDRQTSNKNYVHYLAELLIPELTEFCQEAGVTCQMTDAWCVKYQKGDYQTTHNHRGWGFSGVLYVTYDDEVHTPTKFVAPWNDPRNDCTTLAYPPRITEGVLFIAPSWALHFVEPNESRKERVVIVFDLLPKLPSHQSINIDDK